IRFVDGLSMHMINSQTAKVMNAETLEAQSEIMKDSPKVQQLAFYLADSLAAVRNEMIALITEGYNTGVQRLVTLMAPATKGGLDRQQITPRAEEREAWDTLKAHIRYIELRAVNGLDHATAAEFIKRYAEYRVLKSTDLPALTAADPTQFADMEFPAVLLKS